VDLNIKDLDDAVGQRLREQAAAAGLSVQQYLRNELARIAARRSPAELVADSEPMSRADFEGIRERLRAVDAR
jgi:plasmid stability protein